MAELTSEDRAAVAIARAMQDYHSGGGLIIFDESTRALTKAARSQFFEMVRGVIDSGASVLLISHQLEEIVEVTDRVTVLRDGAVVESGIATKDTDEAGLTRLMLGRHMVLHSRVDSHATSDSAAVVRKLTVRSVQGFDLDLKKGEIVGTDRAGRIGRGGGGGGGRRCPRGQIGHADRGRPGDLAQAAPRLDRGVHRGRRGLRGGGDASSRASRRSCRWPTT